MAVRPHCAIAQTELSYPVLVYTKVEAHDFEMIKDVDSNDGGRADEEVCVERFHIDAIAEHIATRLVDRVEVLCPNCNRHLDGIRLDIAKVSALEEEPYRMVGTPHVLALATEIARQFRESSLVEGIPRVQELTIDQMIAMRDRLIQPIIPPHNEEEGECVFDDCVSKAGPFALVAGIAFAAWSVVNFIFTPAGASDEPKKNPHHSRGALVNMDYLETKC